MKVEGAARLAGELADASAALFRVVFARMGTRGTS